MYSIHIDEAHGLIEVQLHGMMSPDEVAAYIAELKRRSSLTVYAGIG